MSAQPRLRGDWAGRGSGMPAVEQVVGAVSQLRRARQVQLLVEHLASALCVGLFLASAAVLAIRLDLIPLPAGWTIAVILAWALLAGSLLAWRHRPDALGVAIAADVRMNLKQRLSTAYELVDDDVRTPLTDRLAAQAVQARLPGRSAAVFPLRVNALGLAAPVGLILLLLVSIIDLGAGADEPRAVIDESVQSEGLRLREYGVRMRARAERDDLSRSAAQARRLSELGERMNAGALSRDQALDRLRALQEDLDAERRAAMNEGTPVDVGPVSSKRLDGGGAGDARGMLERLQAGDLGEGDLRALAANRQALDAAGIGTEELEQALDGLRQGDPQALRDLLERMAQAEQGAQDAEELRRARERIGQARENLGDTPTPTLPDTATPGGAPTAGATRGDSADAAMPDVGAEEDGVGGSTPLPGASDGTRARSSAREEPASAGATVQARPRIGAEGDVFVSQGRALPRGNAGEAPLSSLSPEYRQQMEEVLASDRYPAHFKDYIRRYFLELSEAERVNTSQ